MVELKKKFVAVYATCFFGFSKTRKMDSRVGLGSVNIMYLLADWAKLQILHFNVFSLNFEGQSKQSAQLC